MAKKARASTVCAPPNVNLTTIPSTATLDSYLGKNISEICSCDYENDSDNHCAHFVSHIIDFSFGFTCKGMTGKGKRGASIRVHQLFAMCQEVGEWQVNICPKPAGLVFVTDRSNVDLDTKHMENHPNKHVGIFLGGTVWHYSNSNDNVVKQSIDQFRHHYSGDSIKVFWGTPPL